MSSQFIGSTYLLLSAFVLLVLAQMSQKPPCINSQVIEKLTLSDDSRLFRCSAKKAVPFSSNFASAQAVIETKIFPFEDWLNRNWDSKPSKIQVTLTNKPTVTFAQNRNLIIWEQNLRNTQQLEVEIAKSYLNSLNSNLFYSNELALNTLAEFVVKVWSENKALSFGGLSTYIAHQWWVAYNELPVKDKFLILRKFPQIIRTAKTKVFSDAETKTYDQVVQLTELFSKESVFFSLLKSRSVFEDNTLTASFDFLVLMPQVRAGILSSLNLVQSNGNQLNLGVWDGKSLYHIGSKTQISASSFSKLKVNHLIWESCDDLELRALLGVQAAVRKLLVVRNCSPQNQPDYTEYIKKGVAGFAASHPQVSFVQLDMPSVIMRKDEIVLQQKIFELMAQQSKSTFLGLYGLQQLYWDPKLQIFVPKSNIDAVESFRVLKTN